MMSAELISSLSEYIHWAILALERPMETTRVIPVAAKNVFLGTDPLKA